MTSSPELSPAALIVDAAAIVSPRFFGLTAASSKPMPKDLPIVKSSIEATQPGRNDMLLRVAAPEKSIKMTAMIGTGLMATPTAEAKIAPIVAPISHCSVRLG